MHQIATTKYNRMAHNNPNKVMLELHMYAKMQKNVVSRLVDYMS